jgi:predicted dehydrogenase
MKELRVAILGYGGIARAHMHGYDLLEKEELPIRRVALCDIDPQQFSAIQEINIKSESEQTTGDLHLYTDFDEMLANEQIDIVDICLPTYLHKEYAIRALRAGKHVQCEKPMALTAADCREMISVAKENGCHLMIGQCLRFNANYLALKELLDSGKYGRVIAAHFERLSALPRWGFECWFRDTARSGGCLQDMGIHDIDMIRFLFGEPQTVTCATYDDEMKRQGSTACLYYENGPIVSANSSWCEASGFPFTSTFRVTAEQATIVWDGRGRVKVYPAGAEAYELTYAQTDHMAEESRYFAEVVSGEHENEKNPPESAMLTVALIERLYESADKGTCPITI